MGKPLLLVIAALLTASCGSSAKTTTTTPATSTPTTTGPAGAVTVASANISGLGQALVNSQGRALYTFAPDKAKAVTCTGQCAAIWPPLTIPAGAKALASGTVKASLLGSDPNPAGGRVVTYAGWPLYTYVTDTGPGVAHGQGLNLNGGLWYVISPGGKVISKSSGAARLY